MGNDNPKSVQQENQEFQQIIPHKRFEKYKFVDNNYIQTTHQVDQQQLNTWKNNLKRIKNFTDHEVLLLEKQFIEDRSGLCTNNYKLDINFDNYPYIFSDQIANRVEIKKYFDEPELWYLLLCLLIASKNFASLKSKIGDVRPYNIFINEQGQIKVANIYSWPYQKTNFQKTAFFNESTYLSPQQMKLIENKISQNTTDRIKSQSFSIGLTMLNSLILYDASQLYNPTFFTFDEKRLAQKLEQMRQFQWIDQQNRRNSYSKLLKGIVYSLCNPNPERRTSSLDLYNILQPYEEQIMKLQPFDHNFVKFQYPSQFRRIENVKSVNILLENRQFGNNYQAGGHQSIKYQQQPQSNQIVYQQFPSVQPFQTIPQQPSSWGQNIQTNQNQFYSTSHQTFQQPPAQIQTQIYQTQRISQPFPPIQERTVEVTQYGSQIPQQKFKQFAGFSPIVSQPQRSQYPTQISTSTQQKPLDPYIPTKIQTITSNNFNFNPIQQQNRIQLSAPQVKEVRLNEMNNQLTNLNYNSFATSIENSVKTSTAYQIKPNEIITTSNSNAFQSDFLRKIEQQLQMSRQKFPSS